MAKEMDEKQLRAAIKKQITSAVGFIGGEINDDRQKLMRDYMGKPLGNEIEGRSQVVSSDVQDTVESVMPDIVRVFTASGEAVKFDPVGEEDEIAAEQATEYVNYIWNVDNPGFNITHDWFKDALLQKNGIIKIWWDDTERTEKRKFTGLTDDQLAALMEEDGVKVLEHTAEIDQQFAEMMAQSGMSEEDLPDTLPPELSAARTHKVTIRRTIKGGRVRIENVPPEEYLISKRAKAQKGAPFQAHKTTPTQSDLIAQGYDKEQIESLPSEDDKFNQEKVERFSDEDMTDDEAADRSTREIVVHECYMYVDWDNDGIAELRKITVGGPAYEILKFSDGTLDNEEVDDDPFASVTPIRMPHKFFGRALAELAQDLGYIKTSVWRQVLDNMYNVNNARAAVSSKVNLDDYLDNKVGAPIRVDVPGEIAGHILPIQTPSIGNHAYPLLEYIDQALETRSGVNRLSQGLDPDALKNTATGINQLLGRSEQRRLLIAEVFANGGVKDAFKKTLRIVIEHQDQPRKIKLKNKWTDIDPSVWNAEMNLTTNVGLGRGTQDQQIATAAKVVEAQQGLVTLQGGVNGPLVTLDLLRNGYANFLEAAGIKSADKFIAPIDKETAEQFAAQAQQAPPPPEIMLEQMKQQGAQQQAQAQAELMQGKAALEAQSEQLKHGLKMEQLQAERDLEAAKFRNKQFDLDAEAQRTAMTTAAHESKTAMDLAAEEHKKAMGIAEHEKTTEITTAAHERKAKAAAKKPKKAAA